MGYEGLLINSHRLECLVQRQCCAVRDRQSCYSLSLSPPISLPGGPVVGSNQALRVLIW
jgi:hypothetical protein